MSKRNKNFVGQPPDRIPLRVQKHIKLLELHSLEGYFKWCEAKRFRVSADKSSTELEQELASVSRDLSRQQEVQRLCANPKKFFEAACLGNLRSREVSNIQWREICLKIESSDKTPASRQSLLKLLNFLYHRADFVIEKVEFGNNSYNYIGAIVEINDLRNLWLRPLSEWTPLSHNPRKQFSALVRHLFTQYPVPAFMDSIWFRENTETKSLTNWFLMLGKGQSIRNAELPIEFTKKMAHHFMLAPDTYSVEQAIRWGQVHALGGDSCLTEAILGSRIGVSFGNNEFWSTVIRFFVDNPMLDRAHFVPIADFIHFQKFQSETRFTAPGVREEVPPAQPNFCMKGRTPHSLLRQVANWHRQLGKIDRAKLAASKWKKSGIQDFKLEVGTSQSKIKIFRIRELLSGIELAQEGQQMRHCVASYARSCEMGHCSIWAMEIESFEGVEKRQTVQVNMQKVIVQCRGRANVLPAQQDMDILQRWAANEGLQIARHVKA